MSHSFTVGTKANYNGSNPLVLSEDELTDFTGIFISNLVKAGLLHSAQLADLLHRIRLAGTIRRWTLYKDNELIASSHALTEANIVDEADPTDDVPYFHPPGEGGPLTYDTNGPIESILQPHIETRNNRITPYHRVNDKVETGFQTTAVQDTHQAQEQAFVKTGASDLPTPADSPRKRRRNTASASPLSNYLNPTTPPVSSAGQISMGRPAKIIEDRTELSARLVVQNPGEVVRLLSDSWHHNVSQGVHALGLPPAWKGINAAANYLRLIQNDNFTDPVAQRAARMLLVLNYEEMCKCPEKHCPLPRDGARKTTYVMGCITRVYLNNSSGEASKPVRDIIHNILKQGRQLWTLAGTAGMGLVLICDDYLMTKIKNNNIYNRGIEAVATHAFYARPATVRLLHSLTAMVTSLIFGRVSPGLADAIRPDGRGILGPSALSSIHEEDHAASINQHATGHWPQIDLKSGASKKKAGLLGSDPETTPSVDHILGGDRPAASPSGHTHPGDDTVVTSPFDEPSLVDSMADLCSDEIFPYDIIPDSLEFGEQQ